MRIAFITESFPKLSETFILGKAAMLARLGHAVTVFTQFPRAGVHPGLLGAIDPRRDVVHLPVWDRVRFRDVTRAFAAVGPRPGRVARAASAALHAPDSRALTFVKCLPFCRDDFDLLHAHYAHMGSRYVDVAAALRLPLIVSLYGTDVTVHLAKNPDAYRPLFGQAARLLPVVDYLRDVVVAHGCAPEKVTVLPTEVDTEFFSPAPRPANPTPVVLTVGRLHWTKGYVYALAAMAALRAAGLRFRYRVIGDGDDRGQLEFAVRDLGLSDCVELAGPRDRDGVAAEMRAADIFLLPSVIEGIGGVLLEAQACGLPVVATRVGGLPEAVRDGETGILVPSRDPAALAAALRRLLENPAEREALGGRGPAFVRENFDAGRLMGRLVKIYEETVRDARRPD